MVLIPIEDEIGSSFWDHFLMGAPRMPACARKEIVRQGESGIYYAWSRCVRRAFLMGTDPLTGKDYNHRREWVVERLKLLVASFAAIVTGAPHDVSPTLWRVVKRVYNGIVGN